jgi:hypothetical protein
MKATGIPGVKFNSGKVLLIRNAIVAAHYS